MNKLLLCGAGSSPSESAEALAAEGVRVSGCWAGRPKRRGRAEMGVGGPGAVVKVVTVVARRAGHGLVTKSHGRPVTPAERA